jgi:hypothetical protein
MMMSGIAVLSPSLNLSSVVSASTMNRIEMPVLPSQVLYAQLKYVEGVPSESGGVSLDRLRLIDSLIAQMNSHRPPGTPEIRPQNLSSPEAALNSLLQRAHEMQKSASPFQAWGHLTGLAFNLRA